MAKPVYAYVIQGTAANDQTWIVRGKVECDFADAFNAAVKEAFQVVTQGEAVYGHPGMGCHGPYKVIRVGLVRKE